MIADPSGADRAYRQHHGVVTACILKALYCTSGLCYHYPVLCGLVFDIAFPLPRHGVTGLSWCHWFVMVSLPRHGVTGLSWCHSFIMVSLVCHGVTGLSWCHSFIMVSLVCHGVSCSCRPQQQCSGDPAGHYENFPNSGVLPEGELLHVHHATCLSCSPQCLCDSIFPSPSTSLPSPPHPSLCAPPSLPHPLCPASQGCVMYQELHDVLGAYACYRPDVGYVSQPRAFTGLQQTVGALCLWSPCS